MLAATSTTWNRLAVNGRAASFMGETLITLSDLARLDFHRL
jgi:hypothetical protein